MDPLTHALSGALLARATAKRRQQATTLDAAKTLTVLPLHLRVSAGFFAALFPDLDLVLRLIDTITYLNWHQGPTHSLVLLPFWAWLLSVSFRQIYREYRWQLFFFPVCLGLTIHIAEDLITSYGLMLFAPFSTSRFSLPLVFVVDPWFSLIIILGLTGSWLYPNQRITAITALIGLGAYIIFLSTLYHKAIVVSHHHIATHNMNPDAVHVLPQPLSPFHWKLLIRQHDVYHIALMHLGKTTVQTNHNKPVKWLFSDISAAYKPVSENSWQRHNLFGNNPEHWHAVRNAWKQPAFEAFRTFSTLPILERIETTDLELCYWFYDLRFEFPGLPPSFRYGICSDSNSTWHLRRYRGSFYID